MSWEFPRVIFFSLVTVDRFSACFLSCSPHCSQPAHGLLTAPLSRMPKLTKWRWIHVSLWRKNILTLSYGEAAWLLRKLKWVPHEIVFIPSKRAFLITQRQRHGWDGALSLADWTVSLFLFFSASHSSICVPSSTSLHYCVILLQSAQLL